MQNGPVGLVRRFAGKLIACVAVGALLAPIAHGEALDTSTPKSTAIAFAKAVQAGDAATVKALATGSDAEFALIKSISDLSVSMKKLEDAAVKKFGPEAKLPKELALDMVSDFETADEKIDGDKATLVVKSKPDDKFPATLKKDGNGWKLDLTNLSADPQTAVMAQMVPAMVKGLDAVTKNVEDGKYKTVAEAYTDLGAQMAAGIAPPAEPTK